MAPQWHLKGATKPLLTQSCCSVACRRWLRPRTCRSQGFTFESYACAEQLPSHRHTPSSTPGQSLGEGPVRASTPSFAASQCAHMAGISYSVVGWHDAGSALLAVSEAPSPTTSAAASAGDVSGSPLRRRAGFRGSSTATSPLQPTGGASLQPQQALILCSGWLSTKPCNLSERLPASWNNIAGPIRLVRCCQCRPQPTGKCFSACRRVRIPRHLGQPRRGGTAPAAASAWQRSAASIQCRRCSR